MSPSAAAVQASMLLRLDGGRGMANKQSVSRQSGFKGAMTQKRSGDVQLLLPSRYLAGDLLELKAWGR